MALRDLNLERAEAWADQFIRQKLGGDDGLRPPTARYLRELIEHGPQRALIGSAKGKTLARVLFYLLHEGAHEALPLAPGERKAVVRTARGLTEMSDSGKAAGETEA